MIGQTGEHIGEPRPRVYAVELAGLNQRVDGGGAPSAFVRTGEGPVVAADRDTAQCALCGVVRHAQAAVLEEADEAAPAVETGGDKLGGPAGGGPAPPPPPQPSSS